MNDYIYEITLDLNCNHTPVTFFAGQFDKGRKIIVNITANGENFDLTDCASAVCKGINSDGSHFAVEAEIVAGKVVIITDEVMLSERGKTVAKITLSDGEKSYSTQCFVIFVNSAFEGDISGSERYSILNALIDRVIQITDTGGILVDDELNADSKNPVSNSALYELFNGFSENKADKSDTLAGYGITDAYTKDTTKKYLDQKLNVMPFDSVPLQNSPSYLTSGAVYNALLEKYDSSNIETGSGSLTVYTPAAIEIGLIASADFRYHKTGKLAQIFFNIVFNAGTLNYIQFTGLPFGADTMSNQNRVVIATDKHNQAAVYPVGSWLSLNFMGKNFSFAQGEILKGVISIIIK